MTLASGLVLANALSENAYEVADGGMGRQMSGAPDLANSRVKGPGAKPRAL